VNHSYEEIRSAAVDIIAGREKCNWEADQYGNLALDIAEVFLRRELGAAEALTLMRQSRGTPRLSQPDGGLYLEVFWDLFRQGIITLGKNDCNQQFPFFRLSWLGKNILANQSIYFFYDVSSYAGAVKKEIPNVDPVTLLYLQEAMQAFRSGCILSATVMLGVATEHTFELLLDVIKTSTTHSGPFKKVFDDRTILARINKSKHLLDQQVKSLPPGIKEDMDTNFLGILSLIRNFRNESGHPTGKIVDREQTHVLLNLFIPYCKKIYQMKEYFRN
jgi:hypothetical protein